MNAAKYITLSWIKKTGVWLFERIEPLFYSNAPKIPLKIRRNGVDPIERWTACTKIREQMMRLWRDHRQPRRYLRKKYSPETFFSELNRLGVRYVVLRWFEVLPEIAPGEDLDMLVHDDDLPKLDAFLTPYHIANAIKCDIYSVGGLPGSNYRDALLYFPRKLSEGLLANRVLWKNLCFVPSSMDHLLSMTYHVIYQKAERSGLPVDLRNEEGRAKSEERGVKEEGRGVKGEERGEGSEGRAGKRGGLEGKFWAHDYGLVLQNLADKNNVEVDLTLAGLHAFLRLRGVAPGVDLTRKLGVGHSEWLMNLYPKQTFFSTASHASGVFPNVTVFLIREWAIAQGLVNFIMQTLERHGFENAVRLDLNDLQKMRASRELRGGNWGRGPYPVGGGRPAVMLVAVDQHPVKPTGVLAAQQPFLTNQRVCFVKKILRNFVNSRLPIHLQTNFLHSCDDALEVEEYIGVICPELRDRIYSKIQKTVDEYQTREVVLKDLSKEKRRAKVEVIEWRGQKAVKKTYKTGRERFLQREIFAYGELSQKNALIPLLLDAGKNYIILPFFEEICDSQQRKNLIRENLPDIARFLKFLFDEGFTHLDFKPENLLFTSAGKLQIIDFEYLQPYQKIPAIFGKSYDFVGAPTDFLGDLPVGEHRFIERRWRDIFGKRLAQLLQ